MNKPYVLLQDYMPGRELTFGIREDHGEYAGLYLLGDGDLLTEEQLTEYDPTYLTERELCMTLRAGLRTAS